MEKNIFTGFTNQFKLCKSISFELIPQGNTLKNMQAKGIIDDDKLRADNYQTLKKGIDEYHKHFINRTLSTLNVLEGLEEYAELYKIPYMEKTEPQIKRFIELENNLRKQIANHMKSDDVYFMLFSKELCSNLLPEFFVQNEEMLEIIRSFNGFTTYLTNFNALRESLYSADRKKSSIAYRIINENLPRFLTNIENLKVIKETPIAHSFSDIENQLKSAAGSNCVAGTINKMSDLDYFITTVTQSGIEYYNLFINGYADEDGKLHKGLNSVINEYNQSHSTNKVPLLLPLYKQLLSDENTASFVLDKFVSDQEVLNCIKNYYNEKKDVIKNLESLVTSLDSYDLSRIYIRNDGAVNKISNALFGDYEYIQHELDLAYDNEHRGKVVKNEEKYIEKRRRHFARIPSYSIAELNDVLENSEAKHVVQDVFKAKGHNDGFTFETIDNKYNNMGELVSEEFPASRTLRNEKNSIRLIKQFLDAVKDWERTLKPLCGDGTEIDKDSLFYSQFDPLWNELNEFDALYNKVRNYLTKKISVTDKIKLSFSNPALGSGWSTTIERERGCLLFKKVNPDGLDYYYLGIIDKDSRSQFKEYPEPKSPQDAIQKMFYYQSADPSKITLNLMVIDGETKKVNGKKEKYGPHAGKNMLLEEAKNKYLPKEINRIRRNKGYLKRSEHFNLHDLHTFIAYYKERLVEYLPEIDFGADFKDILFDDWNDFTAYIKRKAYQVSLREISLSWLNKRVENGDIYLFQLYNKDFSSGKKGKLTINTRYLNMLFAPENFQNGTVYKLNSGAQIYYRPAALRLKDTSIHVKNEPIPNKNPLNAKKESVFNYNIIKNRKATKDVFIFTCSIDCNFSAEKNEPLNLKAQKAIRTTTSPVRMIGLSRGENHLLYYSVVEQDGTILEQKSLNIIETIAPSGEVFKTDYHRLLDAKEKSRTSAKQEWQTIEDIKNLKEGYISQVVSVLTKLMLKYNACLCLENLSTDFVSSRQKIEKNVYLKLDASLANKLSFLIDKDIADNAIESSLLRPLQLAVPDGKGNQNGFLFYVNPAYTTTLDPATGFINMFGNRLKYTNANNAALFVRKLQDIKYNKNCDYFEINFDYTNFGIKKAGRTQWTVCTNGSRTNGSRNKKTGRWKFDSVDLTDEFKKFFNENNIDIMANIQEQLLMNASAQLLRRFMELLSLTMQMRNKIAGEDHIISPVKAADGTFYNTSENNENIPDCAAANCAYNIARKGLMYINKINGMDSRGPAKLYIENSEWLDVAQKQ